MKVHKENVVTVVPDWTDWLFVNHSIEVGWWCKRVQFVVTLEPG